MTLRERVAQIDPEAIGDSYIGGVSGCPSGYFKRLNCDGSYLPFDLECPMNSDGTLCSCEECWSREYDTHILEPIALEENHFNQKIENSQIDNELVDCDEEHIDRVNESLSGNMKRTLFEMRELNDKLSQILFLLTGKPQDKFEEEHDFTSFIGISLKQKQNVEHSLDVVDEILIALKGTSTNEN